MDTATLDFNTLTLLVAIMGSTLTTVILMFRQSDHFDRKLQELDTKFDTKIDALDTTLTGRIDTLDTKLTGRIDALDTKFDTKFDALAGDVADVRERLGRIEGHLMGPESFAPRSRIKPERDDPPSDRRAAG